jgi:type IV pilus assembly protein PilB
VLEYQNFLHQGVVARFKILSDLKIDESRIPQDGRISKVIEGKSLDLRVSTLPTVHGEKIVMRIVDKSKTIPQLTDL